MEVHITPVSMIRKDGMQRIDVDTYYERSAHLTIKAYDDELGAFLGQSPLNINSGESKSVAFLPMQNNDVSVRWEIYDEDTNLVFEQKSIWPKPRKWSFYIMISSHTDIGLHNPPYIQRYNTAECIDEAIDLCDATDDRDERSKYHYTIEGGYIFELYPSQRTPEQTKKLLDDYISKKRINVCTGIAGNHYQTFGLEEMARCAYERRKLKEKWGIDCKTIALIDMNGMPWSMIQPFADAGYENMIFSPNQWNPYLSTIWHNDPNVGPVALNCESGGGGSRIDMRFSSALPRVFYWRASDQKSKLLVWSGGMYSNGGVLFGFTPKTWPYQFDDRRMEDSFAKQLPRIEKRIPYDIWLIPCYDDDDKPNLGLTNTIHEWNQRWLWPELRTMGDPDEPFNLLKQRFGDVIPTISGDITGGWFQHPIAAPDYLSRKFEADRLLPVAESLSTIASVIDSNYSYPAIEFEHAWESLFYNDEHSYGTSGYQGRRVYETWMQHRDWIDKALQTAHAESEKAFSCICRNISSSEEAVVAFNPSSTRRIERIAYEDTVSEPVEIPGFGYTVIKNRSFSNDEKKLIHCESAPIIENEYYRIVFAENGTIKSIFDKSFEREITDSNNEFDTNCFVWTQDGHKSFNVPKSARFEMISSKKGIEVVSYANEQLSGASIEQHVSLPHNEKRIDIDNRLFHVMGLYNNDRYKKYAYYSFPFAVSNPKRICHLNGCEAEYGVDLTGHATDVYMAASDWVCVENDELSIGVVQIDSQLVEFDHIHPDKTDYGMPGKGSAMFFYLANDWLQMHSAGGTHMNLRFRYSITTFKGGHKQIDSLADRLTHPVITHKISTQNGLLNKESMSFVSSDARILVLKPADDANGLIIRLYGDNPKINQINDDVFGKTTTSPCTVDERQSSTIAEKGFATFRINGNKLNVTTIDKTENQYLGVTNTPIGSAYTRLISDLCAARGENEGHIYLLWGALTGNDLAGYNVYRSEQKGFEPNDDSFIAFAEPEKYCVGRFEDKGLKHHTKYYYRVCAVDKNGNKGPFTREVGAWTKE